MVGLQNFRDLWYFRVIFNIGNKRVTVDTTFGDRVLGRRLDDEYFHVVYRSNAGTDKLTFGRYQGPY